MRRYALPALVGAAVLLILLGVWIGWFAKAPTASLDLVLATTTSTQDSGLLDVLLPPFERESHIQVKVIAVGTGQSLAIGRRGDADVLLVHAPALEAAFMKAGYGGVRRPLMFNDFVILGPAADPARVKGSGSAAAAFSRIAASRRPFVSRGDNSGTQAKERSLWEKAGIKPTGSWYLEAGSGMAASLRLASEKEAYILSDRGTFLSLRNQLRLVLLLEGDPGLFNLYSVITVSPKKWPKVNSAGAQALLDYLFSPTARRTIASFGQAEYGQPLFHLYASPEKPARP